jgi:hypothetical protein
MTDDVEKAERAGLRRARIVTISAVLFVATFAASQDGGRSVDHVRLGAWVLWSVMLLVILVGGGGWSQNFGVRQLMNDDVTRDHRQRSLVVGFWVAMGTAALTFVIDRYKPFPGQEASRLIITFGIAAALLWFGRLEWRAYRNG